jgi:hypothetical protein
MAIWGIGTGTETSDNNYNLPKHLSENDGTNTTHDCFADGRGWVYRRYGTPDHSGLSTSYYDEVLVPISGLNTTGVSSTRGLGVATPTAIFFADPNRSSNISTLGGATAGIQTGATGYVHLVFNENVYVSAGATVKINVTNLTDVSQGSILGYASSIAPGATVHNYVNGEGMKAFTNYNGQITNRVAFAFTAPTVTSRRLRIDTVRAFAGVITDMSGGVGVTSTYTANLIRNVGGAGNTAAVGIGTTFLTLVA